MKRQQFIQMIVSLALILLLQGAFADSVVINGNWSGQSVSKPITSGLGGKSLNNLTELTISTGVLGDGDIMWMSKNLKNLKKLTINGQTSFTDNCIPEGAFSVNSLIGTNMEALESITIDLDSKTPLKVSKKCLYLLPNLKTVNATSVVESESSFISRCPMVESVNLPMMKKLGSSGVSNLPLLTYLNMQEVEYIDTYGLMQLPKLTEVDLPKLKSAGALFLNGNISLKEVKLHSLEVLNETAMKECDNLQIVDLPLLTEIDYDNFSDNKSLLEVRAPLVKKIHDKAFTNCPKLYRAEYPLVTEIGTGAFKEASSLRKIDFPLVKELTHAFYENTSLREVNLPALEKLDSSSLKGASSVEKLDFPNLKYIGGHSIVGALNLKELNIPNVEYVGEWSISYLPSLRYLELPKLKTAGPESFKELKGLQDIYLPLLEKTEDYAFMRVANLNNVNLPSLKEYSVGTFRDCKRVAFANLPKITTFSSYLFSSDYSMKYMSMPNVTSFEKNAFITFRHPIDIQLNNVPSIHEEGIFYMPNGRYPFIYSKSEMMGDFKIASGTRGMFDNFIVINRDESYPHISSLKINGKALEDFTPYNNYYELGETNDMTIKIDVKLKDSGRIEGNIGEFTLQQGANVYKIEVTSSDGVFTVPYYFRVFCRNEKAPKKISTTNLAQVTIDGEPIKDFDPDQYVYYIPRKGRDMITMDAKAENPDSSVTGNIGDQSVISETNMFEYHYIQVESDDRTETTYYQFHYID